MLQVKDFNALISCCNQNGGLYHLKRQKGMNALQIILDIECRGIARYGKGFVVASNEEGIIFLDESLNVVNFSHAGKGLDLHGIAISGDFAYLAETKLNCIGIYDLSNGLNRVDEICFSSNRATDICHINDIFIEGNSLFVSMFHLPGQFNVGGGVVEYSLKKKKVKNVLYEGISQPHSVMLYKNDLYFCNSEEFSVRKENNILFKCLGYTRGLAVQNETVLIGQSITRHINKLLEKHPNISSDCGVYLLNMNNKLSTFVPIPSLEIYGIIFI